VERRSGSQPDDSFERADLPTQRRLREIEPLCRATEVELFGNRDERAQVANLEPLRGAKRDDLAALFHGSEYAHAARAA
jgi:hypothetical protein